MQIALKVSDLGHLSAPRDIHQQWVDRLQEEFFCQVPHPIPSLHGSCRTRNHRQLAGDLLFVALTGDCGLGCVGRQRSAQHAASVPFDGQNQAGHYDSPGAPPTIAVVSRVLGEKSVTKQQNKRLFRFERVVSYFLTNAVWLLSCRYAGRLFRSCRDAAVQQLSHSIQHVPPHAGGAAPIEVPRVKWI
jgi:hypothetical protein